MRGQGARNIIADNISATSAQINDQKRMNRHWKMCWKCQKDKPVYGGKLRISTGLHLFICKSCMDAKQNKTQEKP